MNTGPSLLFFSTLNSKDNFSLNPSRHKTPLLLYGHADCSMAFFLSRVSILLLTRQLILPAVCPSVTRWYCMKTAQNIVIVFFTIRYPNHSSFTSIKYLYRYAIPTGSGHPLRGQYRWGIKIARFSTNKSLYLANDTRYRRGSYGRQIGTYSYAIYQMVPFPMTLNEP